MGPVKCVTIGTFVAHWWWTPSGPTGDGRCFFILKKDGDGGMI